MTYLYQIDHKLTDGEIGMVTHLFNCDQEGTASKENYEFIVLDFILELLQKCQGLTEKGQIVRDSIIDKLKLAKQNEII